jgi:pimeloyl-ACP methyl ester carboxylesterase
MRAQQLILGLVSAEIVPNAGHIMTLDQPGFVAERLLEFLEN